MGFDCIPRLTNMQGCSHDDWIIGSCIPPLPMDTVLSKPEGSTALPNSFVILRSEATTLAPARFAMNYLAIHGKSRAAQVLHGSTRILN